MPEIEKNLVLIITYNIVNIHMYSKDIYKSTLYDRVNEIIIFILLVVGKTHCNKEEEGEE